MPRKLLVYTLGFLLGVSTLTGCSSFSTGYTRVFRRMEIELEQHSRALNHLQLLCDQFDHRLSGSQPATRAEELCALWLRLYGYSNVYFQPFTFRQWFRDSLDLRVETAGKSLSLPALSLAFTPQATIKAPLVDLGNGAFENYKHCNVEGCVVLFTSDSLLTTPEKISYAIAQGAAACLVINHHGDQRPATGTASLDGLPVSIPAVGISQSDGRWLKEQAALRQVTVRLHCRSTYREVTARNVVARLEGSELPHETIVVGAHLDTWDIAPGALDNSSGVATLLDMARLFKTLELQPRRSIEFVLFSAQEQGGIGSRVYVTEAQRRNTLHQIRYMFNLDGPESAFGFNLMGRYECEDLFAAVAPTLHAPNLQSDHNAFLFEGIPTFSLVGTSFFKEVEHTRNDHPEGWTEEMIRPGVLLGAQMVYSLAQTPHLPATRFTPAQTRNYLIENQFQSRLILSGEWSWD